jgi:hypothetical protein
MKPLDVILIHFFEKQVFSILLMDVLNESFSPTLFATLPECFFFPKVKLKV